MSTDSPPRAPRPPHPLAVALIERFRSLPTARIVEFGAGSGRNTRALTQAGYTVIDVTPGASADAALSTHALLHGTPQTIALALSRIGQSLLPDAPLFATFGSVRDARYGAGEEIEPHVFAARDGDEAGVPHAFFSESRLRELLDPDWTIESVREVGVDTIAGTWAHQTTPLHDAVHWFVVARKR